MKRVFLCFASLWIAIAGYTQILEPVKWSFSLENYDNREAKLIFKATIEKGWHLYSQNIPDGGPIRTSFTFEENDGFTRIDTVMEPVPEEEMDPNFGMVLRYFSNEAVFRQKIRLNTQEPLTIKGFLEYMCCDDTKCLPPTEVDFAFNVNGEMSAAAVDSTISEEVSPVLPVVEVQELNLPGQDTAESVSVETMDARNLSGDTGVHKGLWLFFFISIVAGFAAILTPCVFPMIPMTVTFFMHSNENKTRARIQAVIYGISIIAIYTLIGSVLAVIAGPDIANFLSTHWLPNILFFLIFIVFAASFLGMFEITLPSWLITKSDKKADTGGYIGSVFMAVTLVLVSFSCTGPIVGAILVESAGGQVTKPIVGMFGFSLAFALPFTLFAFFPSWLSSLPKSGGWLNSVKVVLGFIELALGLKFLSIADQTYHWGILDREVYLAFWIVIFTLMGLYLLGKLRFAHDSELKHLGVPRTILAIITFSFVVYLIPGMFGAPLKALSGYLPPQQTHDFDLHAIIREEAMTSPGGFGSISPGIQSICEKPKYRDFLHLPHGLEGYFDYDQGLACARKLSKPIFIDFTGHGCVNCREMEATVWSHPKVLQRLRDEFVILALYVDDKTKLQESEWTVSEHDGKTKKSIGKKFADLQITRFGVNAQPYYVLLDHDETMLTAPRAYDLDVEEFVDFLDRGIAEFNKRHGN